MSMIDDILDGKEPNYKADFKSVPAKMVQVPEKNLCNKTRDINNPYEVWQSIDGKWEWRVLRKYQTPSKEAANPYARWFCAVKSPMTFGTWDFGDTYVSDVKKFAIKRGK